MAHLKGDPPDLQPFWNDKCTKLSKKLWFPSLNEELVDFDHISSFKCYNKFINFSSFTTEKRSSPNQDFQKLFEDPKILEDKQKKLRKRLMKKEQKTLDKQKVKMDKLLANFKEQLKSSHSNDKKEQKKKFEGIVNKIKVKQNAEHNERLEKYEENIENINKVIKTRKVNLKLTPEQKKIIYQWFDDCTDVYNITVEYFNSHMYKPEPDDIVQNIPVCPWWDFGKMREIIKPLIPQKLLARTPCNILTQEIQSFVTNAKSAFTNIKRGNIRHFTFKQKTKIRKVQTLTLEKDNMHANGFYKTYFNEYIKPCDKMFEFTKIASDCKLTWNRKLNRICLWCPKYYEKKEIEHRHPVAVLDPGEKIFQTVYGLNHAIKIGEDFRKGVLRREARIRKLQRFYSQINEMIKDIHIIGKLRKKLRSKRRKFKRVLNTQYKKMEHLVDELHYKTIDFLCKNYDAILIPEFATQNMIRNNNSKSESFRAVKANKAKLKKEELKPYKRKIRLNSRVKFVLQQMRHYKFRQRLLAKGQEYGCLIKVVTEEYTSKTCGKCGNMKPPSGREYKCDKCKFHIHRDVNGARNILIKNWDLIVEKRRVQPEARLSPKKRVMTV